MNEHKEVKQPKFFLWPRISKAAKEIKEETTEVGYVPLKDFEQYATEVSVPSPFSTPTVPGMVDDDAITAGAMSQLLGNPTPIVPQKTPRAFMTCGHSLESLDSNASFSSANSRLSGSEYTNSFDAFQGSEHGSSSSSGTNSLSYIGKAFFDNVFSEQNGKILKAPSLPLGGKTPTTRRNSYPSTDSGVSSPTSSSGSNSPSSSLKRFGLQVIVPENMIKDSLSSLKRTSSLNDGEFVKPSTFSTNPVPAPVRANTAAKDGEGR